MELDRTSWLYKAYLFGYFTFSGRIVARRKQNLDLCTLVCRLFLAFLKALFFLFVAGMAVTSIGILIYEVGIIPFLFGLTGIIVFIGSIFGGMYLHDIVQDYRDSLEPREPGKVRQFINSYYRSIKEKTCPLIKINDKW